MTWAPTVIDLVGVVGTILVVVAYFLTQIRVMNAKHWAFPAANLFGSILIYWSLYYNFNLASALMEFFWIGISLFGLVQCYREREIYSEKA